MKSTTTLRMSARIAAKFHIDPVRVIRSGFTDYAIRAAAYSYIQDLEAEEARKRQAQQQAKQPR